MMADRNGATINIRARKSDVELFDRAAVALGVSRSALIRHAAEAHARRVLSLADTAEGDK